MLFDAGVCRFYELKNTAQPGDMPHEVLLFKNEAYYGERVIGYNRQYAARGVNEQVDMLIRVWGDRSLHIHMYCIPEDGEQYIVSNIQHLKDDGLDVTDVTLTRLERYYEVER